MVTDSDIPEQTTSIAGFAPVSDLLKCLLKVCLLYMYLVHGGLLYIGIVGESHQAGFTADQSDLCAGHPL